VREDGVVELLGRGDDAVKVRGYLVEPAEVETALRRLPSVVDVAVRGAGADDEARLVAWVVAAAGEAPTAAQLRRALGEALPEWMVPRDVVFLPELPRNERGKVDVRALPAPPVDRNVTEPETPTEALVEQVWSGVLDLEHVGREESFTALGGESLSTEEMLAALEQELKVSLTTEDLAAHPTLAEFAAFLDDLQQRSASRTAAIAGPATTAARALGRVVGRLRSAGGR
jgi:acyl carrier protein